MKDSSSGKCARRVALLSLISVLASATGCDSASDPAALASDEMTLEFFSEIIPSDSPLIGQVKNGTSSQGWVSFEHGFLTPESGYELRAELRVLTDRIDLAIIAERKTVGSSAVEGHRFIARIYRFPDGQHRVRVLVEFPGTDEPVRILEDGLTGFGL